MSNKPNHFQKRIVFTPGGKGGVGKTSVAVALADWYSTHQIPVTLLDMDIENKTKGSLSQFFSGTSKININPPTGLDAFIDHLDDGAPIILGDMGAGASHVAHRWFDTMHGAVTQLGIGFTAVGVVTDDPASVDSLLSWAAHLQDRVRYLIVENELSEHAAFAHWQSEQAGKFREIFKPAVMRMAYRVPDLENACRNHGVTLQQVADRETNAAELQKTSLVLRAQAYRTKLFAEIDKVRPVLLP
jgi:hypothetical protein